MTRPQEVCCKFNALRIAALQKITFQAACLSAQAQNSMNVVVVVSAETNTTFVYSNIHMSNERIVD